MGPFSRVRHVSDQQSTFSVQIGHPLERQDVDGARAIYHTDPQQTHTQYIYIYTYNAWRTHRPATNNTIKKEERNKRLEIIQTRKQTLYLYTVDGRRSPPKRGPLKS